MIEGIITRIRAEYAAQHQGEMTTLATGGLAPLFAKATDMLQHTVPNLTLEGLRMIYNRRKKEEKS